VDNEFAAIAATLVLAAASVYAGVKKAVFQCLAAAGAALFVLAEAVKQF
jgi:hypothetical protein